MGAFLGHTQNRFEKELLEMGILRIGRRGDLERPRWKICSHDFRNRLNFGENRTIGIAAAIS